MIKNLYIPEVESEVTARLKIAVEELKEIEQQLSQLRFEKQKLAEKYNLDDLRDYKNKLLRKLDDLF